MLISSLLGVQSPLGWLCEISIEEALLSIAVLKISLGWTIEEFKLPKLATVIELILFLVSSVKTTNASLS